MSWLSMVQRCNTKSSTSYADYGGRGITVCSRWRKFDNFVEDMGVRPSSLHTLDRIDSNGHYEISNCRWSTAKAQARNRRSNHLIEIGGEVRSVAAWAEVAGLEQGTLGHRIRSGWDPKTAVTTPVGTINPAYVSFASGRAVGKKLSADQVTSIVQKASTGRYTAVSLGKEYGVSASAICHVLKQFNIRLKKGRPKCV